MNSDNNAGGTLGNFKFNSVGREEAATEILQQQVDPATRTRNIIFALIAVVVLLGIVWASFQKSGKDIFEKPRDTRPLQAPEHNVNGL